jgi:Kef-type K+ transport system membrane component KefB
MDVAEVLRDILVVLVAAKAAAELAERLGVPAVVGEILAGILVGPSVLGLVGDGDEVLRTLGEIGVILLLLEVGLEMDIGELAKVGRASMLVATVGVVCPLVLGFAAMSLGGEDAETALFVGAALTATSVGITARVFGDLKALATTEARLVLGAAVVDDVMGLIVLTVVVRVVTEGSVSLMSVAGIFGVALLFLVLATVLGLRLAPPLFQALDRAARSPGTLVALALAFTLAFAELATAAKLAPIVGAFVAGIALSRSDRSERIRRELAPVGHLFVPVFFLQIGIDADIRAFFSLPVLGVAAVLLAAAVVGKLVSPIGAIGAPGDKVLIGLGMLPRGEVGLIFATIGLQAGVLDRDLYAALLLVVLATTLVAPQLLKARTAQLRRAGAAGPGTAPAPSVERVDEPPAGWLTVRDGEVHLRAAPGDTQVLHVALDAAVRVGRHRPGADLLDRLAALPDAPLRWTAAERDALVDVVERGNGRSWRFLVASGVLDRALPELAAALRRRRDDPFVVDPVSTYRLAAMDRLRLLDGDDPVVLECRRLAHPDRLFLGALLAEGLQDAAEPVADARTALDRLAVAGDDATAIADLVADRDLLWSASRQPGALGEDAVVQLAAHLATPDRARLLYCVSALRSDGHERWELQRLRELHDLVQAVLADPDLSGPAERSLDGRRRADAVVLLGNGRSPTAERIERAPRSYVLRRPAEAIARHARLVEPLPRRGEVRVAAFDAGGAGAARAGPGGPWDLDVAARDRHGLLATVTAALAAADLDVRDAVVATWPDGAVVESFTVVGPRPDPDTLRTAIAATLDRPLAWRHAPDTDVDFDGAASPWHTVCDVRAADRPALLHDVAAAFAAAGVDVVAARVHVDDGLVVDHFHLVGHDGAKLTAADRDRARRLLHDGSQRSAGDRIARVRRLRAGAVVPADRT